MKNFLLIVMVLASTSLFVQMGFAHTDIARIVPGAEAQLNVLLNRPALVSPAAAVPLGRNWFRLELDSHIFSDQVSLNQVRAVLLDFENHDSIFDGTRNRRELNIVSRTAGEIIADFVSITPAPLGIQIRTNYRVTMRTIESTDTRFVFEIIQTPEDSASNRNMRNHRAVRFVEETIINGRTYTYIRLYSINDVNGSMLPNARSVFERNAAPANEENMQLIINAAKLR
ncbi:MAG: hypothetical protein FWC97_05155 [Treponema sp.]|nr:hypothetical protein [Treponema sp.]